LGTLGHPSDRSVGSLVSADAPSAARSCVRSNRLTECHRIYGEYVGPAWDEALAADRPVLYEAITDPEVPPLPPHITLEQAHYYLTALVGDPDRGAMIMESLKQKLAGFVPGR
jgi:hypothetical protein